MSEVKKKKRGLIKEKLKNWTQREMKELDKSKVIKEAEPMKAKTKPKMKKTKKKSPG